MNVVIQVKECDDGHPVGSCSSSCHSRDRCETSGILSTCSIDRNVEKRVFRRHRRWNSIWRDWLKQFMMVNRMQIPEHVHRIPNPTMAWALFGRISGIGSCVTRLLTDDNLCGDQRF